MKKYPTISVIVPVYNTEKFLKRCIESLINQTYQELEIILVNDASTDGSPEIIEEYLQTDPRVKCVEHEKNRGLFQARITGVQASTGKYIAFVDSDDHVSIDWFRLLVKKAEETQADITVGEWCFEYENGWREYLNLDPFRIQDLCLEGDDVIKEFMNQEGRCFSWHVVWNKLYSRQLWDQCESDFVSFSEEHGHMLMWEDVAFSSGFWNCAKKVVNVHGGNYFYYKHSEASTSQFSVKNTARGKKYINDSFSSMQFFKKMLDKYNHYNSYSQNYNSWFLRCKADVYNDLVANLSAKTYLKEIIDKFGEVNRGDLKVEDFFYRYKTQMGHPLDWSEELKSIIASEDIDIVSFDVFDTLVQRPFCEPTDLFNILSDYFNKIIHTASYVDFKSIRIWAEQECRMHSKLTHPAIEEITLDEIYDYISDHLCFDPNILMQTKQQEIQLEYLFCKTRKSGKELFELAQYCHKKVIICSDMYLPKNVVENILRQSGYSDYYKLYISSEVKYTKHTGHIFDYICKDLSIDKKNRNRIVHIGDNWESDIVQPQKKGWRASHLSKAIDIFKGNNPGIYGGDLYKNVMQNTYHFVDTYWAAHDFIGLSCVYGMISNKIYDNPYISFNRNSDFNLNPYMIGYMALGPHLLALVQWIEENRKSLNSNKVHFVARDGFLVKKAYDIIHKDKQHSNYIRLSRKALILADVDSVPDLYSIRIKANIGNLSPQKLESYLQPLLIKEHLENVYSLLQQRNILYDRKFASIVEYQDTLKIYIENAIDMDLLPDYKKELKNYFSSMIERNDILFDIGYSGRPEASLSNILGFPVNSLYIHTLKDLANKRQERYGCICKTFYDYKPAITGVMREHLLMELGPSTIGYQKKGSTLVPSFEEYKGDYIVEYVTKIIQNAALDFISDFKKTFESYSDNIFFRGYDLSLALEYYLHNSKEIDRRIFSTMEFEDDMGEGRIINALEFWNNEIAQRNQGMGSGVATYGEVIPNMYMDGLFIKFYKWINQHYPYGSKKRELIKSIARRFIH